MKDKNMLILGVVGVGLLGATYFLNGSSEDSTQEISGSASTAVQPPNNLNTPANETVNNYYNIDAPSLTVPNDNTNADVTPTTLQTSKKVSAVQASSGAIAQKSNGELVYNDAGLNFASKTGTLAKVNPTGQSVAVSKKEEKVKTGTSAFGLFTGTGV